MLAQKGESNEIGLGASGGRHMGRLSTEGRPTPSLRA